jgi:hypothetical protein
MLFDHRHTPVRPLSLPSIGVMSRAEADIPASPPELTWHEHGGSAGIPATARLPRLSTIDLAPDL